MQAEIIQLARQQHTQTIPQAVSVIEQMSEVRQREVFDFIDLICFRDGLDGIGDKGRNASVSEVTTTKQSKSQGFYASWKAWHEKNKDILDDEDPWADVRDKNDFGREFSWED